MRSFVQPSEETVLSRTYRPLGRPLFIYVKKASLRRPEVREFVRFYLRRVDLVTQAKYIRTSTRIRNEQLDKLEQALPAIAKLP